MRTQSTLRFFRIERAGALLGLALLGGCAGGRGDENGDGVAVVRSMLVSANGLSQINGLSVSNGLSSANGLSVSNGLSSANGLSVSNGLMTTDSGRNTVAYLVRCALAAGDSLIKTDQYNSTFTFQGAIGLAPQYKTGACDQACQEALSACLEAHINTSGTHIPLWLVAPMAPIGWGQSPWFPTREGTFFGNVMVTDAAGKLDSYYCNGPGFDSNTVPGRIGANQAGTPYVNAYASTTGLCSPSCAMYGSDGASSCPANNLTWTKPITVWRGQTFQAEKAFGGAYDSAGNWVVGNYGFNTNCTPGTSACAVIADPQNGMGQRVGYISPSKGVQFRNVTVAAAGTNDLVVYYTDGDSAGITRYLTFSVNGGAVQSRPFAGLSNWSKPAGVTVSLAGFIAGSNNAITIVADATHPAPDLDWIEVINTASTPSVTSPGTGSPGTCDRTKWVASASANPADAAKTIDGDLGSRWTSNRAQDGTDWFQVDFGVQVKLSNLTLNNTMTSGSDYPGGYAVFGSLDGTTFAATPFVTGVGAVGSTVINFPQRTLRAVKIQQTGTANSIHWWSLGELQTTCSL